MNPARARSSVLNIIHRAQHTPAANASDLRITASPLIGWWFGAASALGCADAPRREKCDHVVQLGIAQAIGTEVGHQRFLLARDLAKIALQIPLQALLRIHDLD